MRLTSLNKFIAVFLIGGLPLVWVFLRLCNKDQRDFLADYAFAAGFAVLIVAIFLGTAIDVLTDIFVRTPAETSWKHEKFSAWLEEPSTGHKKLFRWIVAWFWPRKEYGDYSIWKRRFSQVFERSAYVSDDASMFERRAKQIVDLSGKSAEEMGLENTTSTHITAAGIFLKHASKQQLDWLSATYANRILCSNLSVVITFIWLGELAFSIINDERGMLVALVLSIIPLIFLNLALLGRMLDNHFYSYMIALRFASLHCRERMRIPLPKAGKRSATATATPLP